MRFLISPHSFCDLIIGARSIEKHNILGVPILCAGNMTRAVDGRTTAEREQTPAINTLARDIETKQKRLENAKRKLADKSFVEEEARKIVEAEIKDLTQKILEDEKQLRIMKARLALGMAEEFLTKAEKEKKGNIKDLQEKVEAKRKKLSEAEQSVIIG